MDIVAPASDQPAPPGAQPAPKPRLKMIDIAKGFGILLIVLGHNPFFSENFTPSSDFLSAFRLPFFFFISGVMFSMGKRSVGRLAFERADAWLKPVIVVVLLNGLLRMAMGRTTLETTILEIVYETGFTLTWTPMWFLGHLWVVYVAVGWLTTSRKTWIDRPWKRILLIEMLLIVGHYILKHFAEGYTTNACTRIFTFTTKLLDCGLPFSLDLLFMTSAFFLLGHFMSKSIKEFVIHRGYLALSVVVMAICQIFFDADVDFNHRLYDDLIVCTLQAFSGIYIMLSVCTVMARFDQVSKLFAYFGRASLFILIFHGPILQKLVDVLPRLFNSVLLNGAITFIIPLIVPIFIWNLCKRSKWLSLIMLPTKKAKGPSSTAAASEPRSIGGQ